MIRLHPFTALRPPGNLAAEVACVPYDTISTEEARGLAEGHPLSFLRVVRSEIELDPATSAYDPAVYLAAADRLRRMADDGTLVRDAEPSLYLYRQVMHGRPQLGIVGCVEVEQYRRGEIRRHEKTRPDKEDDRTRHLLVTGCHAEPVFLCFRDADGAVAATMAGDTSSRPLFHFVAADGITHTGWRVRDPAPYLRAFEAMERVYIADGHHRSAGADRAAAEIDAGGGGRGGAEHRRFLAVLFPQEQLRILPYNRVVRDLNGLDEAALLAALRQVGEVSDSADGVPESRGEVDFRVGGRWRRLRFDPASIDRSDPIGSLDVSLLQDRVLAPILGIQDPRRDPRIDFVGGIRGIHELARRGDEGGVAFSMHPTSLEELLAVADADMIMPPKSTWFEPKLRSGLFVHEFAPPRTAAPETASP